MSTNHHKEIKNKLQVDGSQIEGNVDIGDKTNIDNRRNNTVNQITNNYYSSLTVVFLVIIASIGTVFFYTRNIAESEKIKDEVPMTTNDQDEISDDKVIELEKREEQGSYENTIKEKGTIPKTAKPIKVVAPPKKTMKNYMLDNVAARVALFNSSLIDLTQFRSALIKRFNTSGATISDGVLLPKFKQDFGGRLEEISFSALETHDFSQKINCICQIQTDVKYNTETEAGMIIHTAKGMVKVYLLNLKTGNLDIHNINMSGSGMSDTAALESLDEHLTISEKLELINITQCK